MTWMSEPDDKADWTVASYLALQVGSYPKWEDEVLTLTRILDR